MSGTSVPILMSLL